MPIGAVVGLDRLPAVKRRGIFARHIQRGMAEQGFYLKDVSAVLKRSCPEGMTEGMGRRPDPRYPGSLCQLTDHLTDGTRVLERRVFLAEPEVRVAVISHIQIGHDGFGSEVADGNETLFRALAHDDDAAVLQVDVRQVDVKHLECAEPGIQKSQDDSFVALVEKRIAGVAQSDHLSYVIICKGDDNFFGDARRADDRHRIDRDDLFRHRPVEQASDCAVVAMHRNGFVGFLQARHEETDVLRFHLREFGDLHLCAAFYEARKGGFVVFKCVWGEAFNLSGQQESFEPAIEGFRANK